MIALVAPETLLILFPFLSFFSSFLGKPSHYEKANIKVLGLSVDDKYTDKREVRYDLTSSWFIS